ncbi:MAG: LytR C-terminal domain-containing protein [Aeromicrobium sp.]
MVAHRKNVPPRQGYVPSSWFIVLTVMVVIGASGWLGWLVLDDDGSADTASPPPGATTPAPSPSVSPSPSAEPTTPAPTTAEPSPTEDEPTPEPAETTEPEPEAEPEVTRSAPVSVLNNTRVTGAARAFATRVTGSGWTLSGVGNWTGSIAGNTVYYPAGLQDQARLLAADVDIARVVPSVAPMRMDRLTIILSGPQ